MHALVILLPPLMMLGVTLACSTHSAAIASGDGHRLDPCPQSPNCVSSLEPEGKHFILPLDYSGPKEAAYQALIDIIAAEPRTRIVTREPDYIRAESKSRVFGFVDEIGFFFPGAEPVIHVRSASRKGYYDFGVNRKRVESIRQSLQAVLNQ